MKYVVGQPLWWALESLGIVSEGEDASEGHQRWWGDYVVMPLLEQAADAVEKKQRTKAITGPSGSLYTFDGFRREFRDIFNPSLDAISVVDGKTLVRYLERDRRLVVVQDQVGTSFFTVSRHV